MLVLTRKSEETIHIGPDITVTILRVKGKVVKIGVEAPREYEVLRGELVAAEGDEDHSAAGTQSADADDDAGLDDPVEPGESIVPVLLALARRRCRSARLETV
jgi:carbon storage regulator